MNAPHLQLLAYSSPAVNGSNVSFVANFGRTSAIFEGSTGLLCSLAREILAAAGQKVEPIKPRVVAPKPTVEKPSDRRKLSPELARAYAEIRAAGEAGPHGTVAAELRRRGIDKSAYASWLQRTKRKEGPQA